MDLHQQREQNLEKWIQEDIDLRKELEDTRRYADCPKEKARLKREIEEVKERIICHQTELDSFVDQKKFKEAIAREMPVITFYELEIVTGFILSAPPAPPDASFTLTDPIQKMLKNKLTENVRFLLTMGMGKVREVNRYVDHCAIVNPDLPERLKAGFVVEYRKLRTRGLEGDILFDSLHKFSSGNSSDFRKMTAGLAILSYLFEKCEVFER